MISRCWSAAWACFAGALMVPAAPDDRPTRGGYVVLVVVFVVVVVVFSFVFVVVVLYFVLIVVVSVISPITAALKLGRL